MVRTDEFIPPYVSWTTLINMFDRLGESVLPNRIDKGLLDTYSGGTQAQVMATLRSLGLIDENGTIQSRLTRMVEEPDSRPEVWSELLHDYYADQLELARQNATAHQLWESFQQYGIKGSTLRKAVVFYLKAVEVAGAPNSPHFKAPKQPRESRAGNRSNSRGSGSESSPDVPPPPPAKDGDESFEKVTLPSGGSIELRINVDLFKLDEAERAFVFGLIDQVRSFASKVSEDHEDEDADEDF